MKIVIAEDNASSRKLLKYHISNVPDYQVVGEAANGEELVTIVNAIKPDVVVVDIEMPLLDGMEAVKCCKELLPALQVIFTTGYDQYAIEAFDVSAIDYIIKPIERKRLYSSLEKAAKSVNNKGISYKRNQIKKNIMLKQKNNFIFIPLDVIIFIEKVDRKSVIHTLNHKFETYESLTTLENDLDSRFIASHRAFIINIDYLTRIEINGQGYKAHFKHYNGVAKVSKYKLSDLQYFKTL
ncbi:LytR/AlgR family response regulator transcription factor [Radiobacillus sp. PE A8.2]|uniref:LytR/AlgR family response regulator transcription factor n=1 Tax=Radiobacillus sp. PE A8.2 TaxID=3380349 RepID=UPI00388E168B